MRQFTACVLLALVADGLAAQASARTVVRVVEVDGRPVPYALVSLSGGNGAIAGDDGRVTVRVPTRDTMEVWARRMGYKPVEGRVPCGGAEGECIVTMLRLASLMDTVRVVASQITPLAKTGFYDRVERVRKGAFTAEFITPEELEARDVSQVSRILEGRRFIRLERVGTTPHRMAVLGRAGCPMTILVDGQRMTKMVEEKVSGLVPTSLDPRGSRQSLGEGHLSIDEVVEGRWVMGIEIYPSTANAPAELIPTSGRGSCGFVAIWTGPRR
jgi:hypothetical protein